MTWKRTIQGGVIGFIGRRDFARDIAVSLLYTGLIVVLIKFKIIQPISNYMPAK